MIRCEGGPSLKDGPSTPGLVPVPRHQEDGAEHLLEVQVEEGAEIGADLEVEP